MPLSNRWAIGQRVISVIMGIMIAFLMIVTGCNSSVDINESDIYFPVPEEAVEAYPDALTQGKLTFDGKYLLLRRHFLIFIRTDILLIWPYGYSLDVKDGKIQVLDEGGRVVARVGDSIKVGGGETTKEVVEENFIGKPLPDDCEGPYWLVSELIND